MPEVTTNRPGSCGSTGVLGYTVPELAEAVGVTAPALADALEQLREELRA